MGFLLILLLGLIIGGVIGFFIAQSILPPTLLAMDAFMVELPVIGIESHGLVVFLTGMFAVLGGGFAARSTI